MDEGIEVSGGKGTGCQGGSGGGWERDWFFMGRGGKLSLRRSNILQCNNTLNLNLNLYGVVLI